MSGQRVFEVPDSMNAWSSEACVTRAGHHDHRYAAEGNNCSPVLVFSPRPANESTSDDPLPAARRGKDER